MVQSNHATETDLHPVIEQSLSHFERRGFKFDDVLQTCKWMATSLPLAPSIDSFLEYQSEGNDLISAVGKLCITAEICQREAQSSLAPRREGIDFASLNSTWIAKAWKLLNKGGGARPQNVLFPGTSFITFNYDRCIERYLQQACMSFYRMDKKTANDFLKTIRIEHVYGSVGNIDSDDMDDDFGCRPHPYQYCPTYQRIKTYSEQVDSETSSRIAEILSESNRVIFLGFSFSKINTDFLANSVKNKSRRESYGSAYGMSFRDTERALYWIKKEISTDWPNVRLEQSPASKFFDDNYLLF